MVGLPPKVDFIKICARLLRTNRMRSFFWRTAFSKKRTNLANFENILVGKVLFPLLVKLNLKYFAERCAPATFRLAKRIW